jgi:hypothetical protein
MRITKRKADELAKHSTRQESDNQTPIPAEDMKSLREEIQIRIPVVAPGGGTGQGTTLFRDNCPDFWFAKCELNTRAVTSVYRLQSGHWTLAHSLAPNGICTWETLEETSDHVLWQCQRFIQERKNLNKGLQHECNQDKDVKLSRAYINQRRQRGGCGPKYNRTW